MDRLSHAYGRILDGLMLVACLLLLAMTLLIGADVVTRNVGLGGIAWSGEVSEDILYLLTLLAAPWLLRQGQHIRVDILLRAAAGKDRLARSSGSAISWGSPARSISSGTAGRCSPPATSRGAITIKTLVTPEWWLLAPLPVAFLLFGRRVRLPHAPPEPGRARPARGRGVGVMRARPCTLGRREAR